MCVMRENVFLFLHVARKGDCDKVVEIVLQCGCAVYFLLCMRPSLEHTQPDAEDEGEDEDLSGSGVDVFYDTEGGMVSPTAAAGFVDFEDGFGDALDTEPSPSLYTGLLLSGVSASGGGDSGGAGEDSRSDRAAVSNVTLRAAFTVSDLFVRCVDESLAKGNRAVVAAVARGFEVRYDASPAGANMLSASLTAIHVVDCRKLALAALNIGNEELSSLPRRALSSHPLDSIWTTATASQIISASLDLIPG